MTITEIEAEFDGEWVLVEDPEIDGDNSVVRGRVLLHSENRDGVDAVAMQLRPKHSAFLYAGPTPDKILINLPCILSYTESIFLHRLINH